MSNGRGAPGATHAHWRHPPTHPPRQPRPSRPVPTIQSQAERGTRSFRQRPATRIRRTRAIGSPQSQPRHPNPSDSSPVPVATGNGRGPPTATPTDHRPATGPCHFWRFNSAGQQTSQDRQPRTGETKGEREPTTRPTARLEERGRQPIALKVASRREAPKRPAEQTRPPADAGTGDWCPGRDSNPHASRRGILSPLRLPISPPGRGYFARHQRSAWGAAKGHCLGLFLGRTPASRPSRTRGARLAKGSMRPITAMGVWRLSPESNRGARLCRPLHDHSATQPKRGIIVGTRGFVTMPMQPRDATQNAARNAAAKRS